MDFSSGVALLCVLLISSSILARDGQPRVPSRAGQAAHSLIFSVILTILAACRRQTDGAGLLWAVLHYTEVEMMETETWLLVSMYVESPARKARDARDAPASRGVEKFERYSSRPLLPRQLGGRIRTWGPAWSASLLLTAFYFWAPAGIPPALQSSLYEHCRPTCITLMLHVPKGTRTIPSVIRLFACCLSLHLAQHVVSNTTSCPDFLSRTRMLYALEPN